MAHLLTGWLPLIPVSAFVLQAGSASMDISPAHTHVATGGSVH